MFKFIVHHIFILSPTTKKLQIFSCELQLVLMYHFRSQYLFLFICRFDGRALLDFIRESKHSRVKEKSEEEEELEEFVNFERYRDLIKHRRRGCRYFFEYDALNLFNI